MTLQSPGGGCCRNGRCCVLFPSEPQLLCAALPKGTCVSHCCSDRDSPEPPSVWDGLQGDSKPNLPGEGSLNKWPLHGVTQIWNLKGIRAFDSVHTQLLWGLFSWSWKCCWPPWACHPEWGNGCLNLPGTMMNLIWINFLPWEIWNKIFPLK